MTVPSAKKSVALTLQDLVGAQASLPEGLLVEDRGEDGAAIMGTQALVYAFLVRCRDGRVKITFSRPNNPFSDAIVLSKDFDADRSFAAALRMLFGDDLRFRNKDRVEAFVKSVGVHEVAKCLPQVFADFMFSVLHSFNCKQGKDVTDQIKKLREQIRPLVPHLSEADVLRIYREEVVDWVSKL